MKLLATADANGKVWVDPLFEIQDEIRKQATRCELGEAPTLAAIRARRIECK